MLKLDVFSRPTHLQASVIWAECELVAPEHGDPPPLVTELPVPAEVSGRTRGQEGSPASDGEEQEADWCRCHHLINMVMENWELTQDTEIRRKVHRPRDKGSNADADHSYPTPHCLRACYLVTRVRSGQQKSQHSLTNFPPQAFFSYPRDYKLHIWPAIL